MLNISEIRKDFPMLDKDFIYFDNGATTFKPYPVINAVNEFYTNYTSNIHRGDYDISIKASKLYDDTRVLVRDFINANDEKEIVFTSGASESLNLILKSYLMPNDSFYEDYTDGKDIQEQAVKKVDLLCLM